MQRIGDLRTTEEVEATRCLRNRKSVKSAMQVCPCGRKGDNVCHPEPNMRVKRIKKLFRLA